MQIYPITSAQTTTSSGTVDTNAPAAKTLGQDDFLKLLATQMSAQDPLQPMQDTEFISQMASFTSLQQMKDLTSSFTTFSTQQAASTAQNYLGKVVSVDDSNTGLSVTGQVTGIAFQSGSPRLVINGQNYDPTKVTAIQASPTNTTSN